MAVAKEELAGKRYLLRDCDENNSSPFPKTAIAERTSASN